MGLSYQVVESIRYSTHHSFTFRLCCPPGCSAEHCTYDASNFQRDENDAAVNIYIIMPVSSDTAFAEKRAILSGLANELDVSFHLPLERDDYTRATPTQVLDELRRADRVIADLSFSRPSCYFEVGLAQGLGKRVHLLATRGSEMHQVFGREDVAYYSDLTEYEGVLRRMLQLQGESAFG